jgi:secondary thiamine-phosphate synthase enzyme
MIRQFSAILPIRASRAGLHEISQEVGEFVDSSGVSEGLLTIFCRHTSASLLIQENAALAARRDVERFFQQVAPEDGSYEHDDEGPDDMPAHLRSALTATQLSIPLHDGRLLLGRWQGIYLFEHRQTPPTREIALHLVGE